MSRSYEDLSRRALVQLGHDFDQSNDAALLQYLDENDSKYEDIRPIEKMTDKMDQLGKKLAISGETLKKAAYNEMNKLMDGVIDTIQSFVTENAEEEV